MYETGPSEQTKTNSFGKKVLQALLPLLVFVVLLFLYFRLTDTEENSSNYFDNNAKVGVVEIYGVIEDSYPVLQDIDALMQKYALKALLVRIDSPGGAVGASQEIYEKLKIVQRTMPVYASILNVGASGGYYAALGADRIYANGGSLTGSIGVIASGFNIGELLEKVGVRPVVNKAGKNKEMFPDYRPPTPEEEEIIRSVLEDTHRQFKQAVLDNRDSIDPNAIDTLADGRIFTGEQAAKNGLIDGVYSFDQVLDIIATDLDSEQVDLVYPPQDEIDYLKEIFNSSVQSMLLSLNSHRIPKLLYLLP